MKILNNLCQPAGSRLLTIFGILLVCLKVPASVVADDSPPRVVAVVTADKQLKLNGEVSVVVSGVGKFLDMMKQKGRNCILFINALPLEGTYPGAISPESDTITFFISHTQQPIQLWNTIALTRRKHELFQTNVSVSIGVEGDSPLPTDVSRYSLRIAQKSWFYTCLGLVVSFLIGFLFLAFKSSILRARGGRYKNGKKPPYSLAYVQMAIWFFTIMSSWLMLYVINHTFNTITDSMVILLGISSATALGSAAIGTSHKSGIRYSRGFLKDILSDDTGATNFHRFQMIAWTFVMVAVFLRQVYSYFCMPDFDASLLVLMGISSGTYLGFKATEQSRSDDAHGTEEKEKAG